MTASGCRFRDVRHDLRFRIRERENERRFRHLREPLRLQYARGDEEVCARQDLGQRVPCTPARTCLAVVHQLEPRPRTPRLDVGHPDVLARCRVDQQIEAGGAAAPAPEHTSFTSSRSLPTTRSLFRIAAPTMIAVPCGRRETPNLHPLAAFLLDVEALGRLDVLEIDAAERGFERDDVDQLVGSSSLISMSKQSSPRILNSTALPSMHTSRRAVRSHQAEHRGAAGHDGHEVAARGRDEASRDRGRFRRTPRQRLAWRRRSRCWVSCLVGSAILPGGNCR